MKVKFLKSGVGRTDYPVARRPEVAIVGRSNAGKSSFINALTNQRVAKVSQTPGKTRLLNFFDLDEKVYMVDMPGYGYATGDRQEVKRWKGMVETYLTERETLKGVLLVMDIRRDWSDDEDQLREWFEASDVPWAIVLNKTDKLTRQKVDAKTREYARALDVPVFGLSSAKKIGFDHVKNLLFKEWGR